MERWLRAKMHCVTTTTKLYSLGRIDSGISFIGTKSKSNIYQYFIVCMIVETEVIQFSDNFDIAAYLLLKKNIKKNVLNGIG